MIFPGIYLQLGIKFKNKEKSLVWMNDFSLANFGKVCCYRFLSRSNTVDSRQLKERITHIIMNKKSKFDQVHLFCTLHYGAIIWIFWLFIDDYLLKTFWIIIQSIFRRNPQQQQQQQQQQRENRSCSNTLSRWEERTTKCCRWRRRRFLSSTWTRVSTWRSWTRRSRWAVVKQKFCLFIVGLVCFFRHTF